MASLPRKGITGDNLKKWVVDTVNGLIDYLHSHRVRPGNGIRVDETPSGVVVSLANIPSASAPSNVTQNGASGIDSAVSGGTASVYLTGGTGSVNFVGTGSVTLSGNTNGQIVINAAGGTASNASFPDLANPIESISFDVSYPGYAYPVWLIGQIGVDSSLTSNNTVVCSVNFGTNGVQVYEWGAGAPGGTKYVPLVFPIPANTPFEVSTVLAGYATELNGSITSYPCI